MKARSTAAIAMSVLMTFAETSHAGDDDVRERASRSFGEAKAAFAQRSYTAAATAFEEAARLVPHPATWLDAAAAWELAGEPARAAEDCDRAVSSAGGDAHGADAAKRLDRLVPRIGTIEIQGRASTLVRIDGGEPFVAPARRRLQPGHHRLVATDPKNGQERTTEVDLAPGVTRNVDVDPEPVSPPTRTAALDAPPRAPSEGGARKESGPFARHAFDAPPPAGSWISFGTAGVAAGVAVAFGVVTLDAKRQFEATPTHETLDTFKRDRLITNVAVGTSVLSAAIGAAIWVWAPRPLRARADQGRGGAAPLGAIPF